MTGKNAGCPRGTGTKFKTDNITKSEARRLCSFNKYNAGKLKSRTQNHRSRSREAAKKGDVMETDNEVEDTEDEAVQSHLIKYYGEKPWKSSVEESESDCSGVLSEPGKVEEVSSVRPKRNKIACSEENIDNINHKKSRKENSETENSLIITTPAEIITDTHATKPQRQSQNTCDSHSEISTTDIVTNPTQTASTNNLVRQNKTNSARIDLNSAEYISQTNKMPKKVFLNSVDPTHPAHKLSKLSPFRIMKEVKFLCGEVNNIEHEHTQSGSLLITTKTHEQVKILLDAKTFGEENIPVKSSIAWSRQLCQGKIYAPAFSGESLEYLLEKLKPCGVVAIRKMFFDPKKAKIPLYH